MPNPWSRSEPCIAKLIGFAHGADRGLGPVEEEGHQAVDLGLREGQPCEMESQGAAHVFFVAVVESALEGVTAQ